MQTMHVVGAALLALVAACADPVSNPRQDEAAAIDDILADQGGDNDNKGDSRGGRTIAVLDDCDPNDPGWAPTGGCTLRRGAVTLEEFNMLLASPLSASVVGHPAWRNEPSYLRVNSSNKVQVKNQGGRFHTFTRVAQFGGGRVPPLNQGLTMAPECALAPGAVDPNGINPGGKLTIGNLRAGNHRYMCCIHPWMRALVKVQTG